MGNIKSPLDFLYRNKGDGTFDRVLTNVVGGLSYGFGAWADYDNDGFLDLYKPSADDMRLHITVLKRQHHGQSSGKAH